MLNGRPRDQTGQPLSCSVVTRYVHCIFSLLSQEKVADAAALASQDFLQCDSRLVDRATQTYPQAHHRSGRRFRPPTTQPQARKPVFKATFDGTEAGNVQRWYNRNKKAAVRQILNANSDKCRLAPEDLESFFSRLLARTPLDTESLVAQLPPITPVDTEAAHLTRPFTAEEIKAVFGTTYV